MRGELGHFIAVKVEKAFECAVKRRAFGQRAASSTLEASATPVWLALPGCPGKVLPAGLGHNRDSKLRSSLRFQQGNSEAN